jgi:ubiquinone/menaquinone biosynthesis C-methylase UbiE
VRLAADAALLKALARINFHPDKARVLDVGGSSGGSLVPFLSLRCPSSNLTCVDISEEAVQLGRSRFPGVSFFHADARSLPFDDRFDLVFSSTIFFQNTDDEVAFAIGREMRRVVKPGGFIVTRDWCRGRPGDQTTKAVTVDRIQRLIGLPVEFSERGALVPPVGRRLSAWAPALYFPVRAIFPFLTGMRVYVMRA